MGRVANGDGTMPEPRRNPVDNGFNNPGMCNDVLPLIRARTPLIMFLDPVGFEHDAVAGFDEVSRKLESVDGLFDQTPDSRSIFVMLRTTKNGNALQGQLGEGLEHDPCCLLQYANFATHPMGRSGACVGRDEMKLT